MKLKSSGTKASHAISLPACVPLSKAAQKQLVWLGN